LIIVDDSRFVHDCSFLLLCLPMISIKSAVVSKSMPECTVASGSLDDQKTVTLLGLDILLRRSGAKEGRTNGRCTTFCISSKSAVLSNPIADCTTASGSLDYQKGSYVIFGPRHALPHQTPPLLIRPDALVQVRAELEAAICTSVLRDVSGMVGGGGVVRVDTGSTTPKLVKRRDTNVA
jgi:hypothetical protein